MRPGVKLCVAMSLGLALGHLQAAELLRNGSFENGQAAWGRLGSRVILSSAPDAPPGLHALRVEGRSQRSDGPVQDVLTALREAGSGRRLVARLHVKLDQPASVRARIEFMDDTGLKRIILAEKVVREAGAWARIEGTAFISWQGSLREARLCFDVARVTEGEYPDYCLAGVSLQPDTDGDRLSDDEERTIGTDPARPDTDSDGVPDGWERANGFDPLRDDAGADADGDGFSNQQEYWAATDPRSTASFPGKPANPKMNRAAREVLRFLALLPSRKEKRVVVGQHVTEIDPEYETQVVALQRQTGKWPGLLSVQYEGQRKPLQVAEANRCVLDYWKQGGLVKIKWRAHDPWTGLPNYQRPARGQPDRVDIPGLLDPAHSTSPQNREANRRAHEVYLGWLSSIAEGLKELRRAGVVVLWRPCSEMNGAWFWWGRRSQQDYLALWRHQYQYLTVEHGLDNLLWVYESASGVHDMVPSDYYYPGDEYVDVMGHNLYDKTWNLPFEANDLYRDYPKVYAFPQAGTAHGQGKPTDGSWDNLTYINQIRVRYPRCSFFAAWNSFATGGGRVPVRLAIVDNPHAKELLEDPWIVTRDRLDWRISER